MKGYIKIIVIATVLILCANTLWAQEEERFTTEKMISELNEKVELTKEQWEKLKPVLGEKSDALKESINEYVEKGYIQLGALSERLKDVSEETEKKLETFLNSEDIQELRNYLNELDDDAIRATKDRMIDELSEVLELSEEQFTKLKPVLDESMSKMSEMIDNLAQQGKSGWNQFIQDYKSLTNELKKKLEETLDNRQMEQFEEYKEEKQEKIQMALASV